MSPAATRPRAVMMPITPHLNAGPVFSDGSTCSFRPDRKRSICTQGVRSPVGSTTAVGPSRIRVPSGIVSRSRPTVVMFSPLADFVAASPECAEKLGRDQVDLAQVGQARLPPARYLCRT